MNVDIDRILRVDRAGFRQWLTENHLSEKECFLLVSRRKGTPGLDYLDAVEEALCFGWIDSTGKNIDGIGYVHRYSPRRKGGRWTELNKARCERLEHLGLMTDSGREALSWAPEFSIDPEIMGILGSDPVLYDNFMSFPELYRRVRIDNIQTFKRSDPELYRKRLGKFIDNTRDGRMYGEWNDDGKLV